MYIFRLIVTKTEIKKTESPFLKHIIGKIKKPTSVLKGNAKHTSSEFKTTSVKTKEEGHTALVWRRGFVPFFK